MIKSMTGYVKRNFCIDDYSINIEIKSVNSKYLDCNVKLLRQFSSLDMEIKKILNKFIKRSKLDVFIEIKNNYKLLKSMKIDSMLFKQRVQIIDDINNEFNLNLDNAKKNDILFSFDDIYNYEEELSTADFKDILFDCLEKTIVEFNLVRENEGKIIYNDILEKIDLIKSEFSYIEKNKDIIQEKFLTNQVSKLNELLSNTVVDKYLILNEAAIISERHCIDEEILRFNLHLNNLIKTLSDNENEVVGKKIDFILQELFREINTLSSKMIDFSIREKVINIKSLLEMIREQIQNIE